MLDKKQDNIELVSYILMALFLGVCFFFHHLPTLLAGMAVFLLIKKTFKAIEPRVKGRTAHKITLSIVVLVSALIISGIFVGCYYMIKAGNSTANGSSNIIDYLFNTLQQLKEYLPAMLVSYIPDDAILLKEKFIEIAKSHSANIFEVTSHSAKVFAHVIVGILIGAVIAFSFLDYKIDDHKTLKPLTSNLLTRITKFLGVFERVIFAQGKISAINTVLTAIYLLIVLPLCGIDLPYAKTLVVLTFVFGLIPTIGNTISNIFIVLISITVSFKVAVASLIFLIVIHKLEYYINAKIVGQQIKTSVWEMLLALIIMETFFGLAGVAVSPIIYGYLKEELKAKNLI